MDQNGLKLPPPLVLQAIGGTNFHKLPGKSLEFLTPPSPQQIPFYIGNFREYYFKRNMHGRFTLTIKPKKILMVWKGFFLVVQKDRPKVPGNFPGNISGITIVRKSNMRFYTSLNSIWRVEPTSCGYTCRGSKLSHCTRLSLLSGGMPILCVPQLDNRATG